MHQATGRDLNLVVGDKHNATVGGDMQERIEGLRKSTAGDGLRLVALKNRIGLESVNLFQVVCDLLDLIEQINVQLAGHVHASSSPPVNAVQFSANAGAATRLLALTREITQ